MQAAAVSPSHPTTHPNSQMNVAAAAAVLQHSVNRPETTAGKRQQMKPYAPSLATRALPAAEPMPPAAVAGTHWPAACSCRVPRDAAYRCTQLKCTTAASQLLLLSSDMAAALAAEAAAAAAPSSRPRNQAPA